MWRIPWPFTSSCLGERSRLCSAPAKVLLVELASLLWHCHFPGCQGLSHPGTTLRQGGKSLRGSGQRQGHLVVLYHIYIYCTIYITIYMCVNAYLCSGDIFESRVWGWKRHSNVCCLVDFQLNLHQLVKPWDCGNLVHFLDNGSYLSS